MAFHAPRGSSENAVTASSNIGDNLLVRGDGGAKGVQGSGIILDDSNNFSLPGDIGHNFGIATQTVADTGGVDLNLVASTGLGVGDGGGINVLGGSAGTVGTGGQAHLYAGNGGTTSGNGGAAVVRGGDATDGLGGDVELQGGTTTGDHDGATIGLIPSAPTGTGVTRYAYIKDPTTNAKASHDTSLMTADRNFQYPDTSGVLALKEQVLQGQTVILTGDVVNNNAVANTIQDVTGLEFPVVAGETYWFKFTIPYTSAAAGTGSRWSINGPAAPTFLAYTGRWTLAATTLTLSNAAAYDIPAASNATSVAAGSVAMIEGFITPSADGTVIARFASEVANSAITAKAGAMVQYQRVL